MSFLFLIRWFYREVNLIATKSMLSNPFDLEVPKLHHLNYTLKCIYCQKL